MRTRRRLPGVVGVLLGVGLVVHGAAVQNDGTRRANANGGAAPVLIVPHESWSCGLPGGLPNPERGTLVFDVTMTLERVADVWTPQYGRRTCAVARGGDCRGARLTASVAAGAL